MTTVVTAWSGPARLPSQEGQELYRVLTVRAAPGRLLELIDLYKEQREVLRAAGDADMLWMRHSQGDQWDLMLMFPMGSFENYHAAGRIRARAQGSNRRWRLGASRRARPGAALS